MRAVGNITDCIRTDVCFVPLGRNSARLALHVARGEDPVGFFAAVGVFVFTFLAFCGLAALLVRALLTPRNPASERYIKESIRRMEEAAPRACGRYG